MSSREEFRGTVLAAAEAGGECATVCSEITLKLEEIGHALEKFAEHQQIAGAMTVNALADADGAPLSANQMLKAAERLGEITIDQRNALALMRERNEKAAQLAMRFTELGREYAASI